jgi:Lsr2
MVAKKIVLVDDLEETEVEADAGTISFALEGTTYELDLSTRNATKLRSQLAPFIAAARTSGKSRARAGSSRPASVKPTGSGLSSDQLNAIRDWAKAQGIQVSDRGRVSAEIRKAYEEAHAGALFTS